MDHSISEADIERRSSSLGKRTGLGDLFGQRDIDPERAYTSELCIAAVSVPWSLSASKLMYESRRRHPGRYL